MALSATIYQFSEIGVYRNHYSVRRGRQFQQGSVSRVRNHLLCFSYIVFAFPKPLRKSAPRTGVHQKPHYAETEMEARESPEITA